MSASPRLSTSAWNGALAPYRIVPVEKMRGASTSPARCISECVKISYESFDGSCSVVTPNASDAASIHERCGIRPSDPMLPCQWQSTKPGVMVLPRASMRVAPAGTVTLALGPTAVMRLPVTTIVPSSSTVSPFIVTMRAPVNAIVPLGLSAA